MKLVLIPNIFKNTKNVSILIEAMNVLFVYVHGIPPKSPSNKNSINKLDFYDLGLFKLDFCS